MSLAELRSQLREFRKTTSSPISKMKKADVVLELEKYKKPVPESVIEKPVKEKVVKDKPVEEKAEVKVSIKSAPRKKKD